MSPIEKFGEMVVVFSSALLFALAIAMASGLWGPHSHDGGRTFHMHLVGF